jgi:hypothetical protein
MAVHITLVKGLTAMPRASQLIKSQFSDSLAVSTCATVSDEALVE